jgi:hypothetical protein
MIPFRKRGQKLCANFIRRGIKKHKVLVQFFELNRGSKNHTTREIHSTPSH